MCVSSWTGSPVLVRGVLCLVPMIRELKWLLCCWGFCFVLFSHAQSESWVRPGPGPGLSFCPLKYSWMAFVVTWVALLCWFRQTSMGRECWAYAQMKPAQTGSSFKKRTVFGGEKNKTKKKMLTAIHAQETRQRYERILTLLENHLRWCHISNATTGGYRVSSFVLGINLVSAGSCASLMAQE